MFRKILVAAVAALTLGAASLAATGSAEARWNGGGGGGGHMFFHHGGGGGGWGHHGGGWGNGGGWRHGGGWGHRRWRGGGWGVGAFPLFLGPGYGYYDDGYYDDGPVCGYRRVRIHTRHGWRIGRQRVCW